jgi:magnesium-transporting ATPase (P-type)
MKEITNLKTYEEIFSSKITPSEGAWQNEALKCALDIRKFEIELYWKRATYFWTLITATFAGYFALQNAEIAKRDGLSIFVISCIGFILSFSWYMVNRGSKYWQENWERHVDVLTERVIGPLYRTTLSSEKWRILLPHEAFPFSVTRVNQVVSLFITLLWVGLAYRAFPMSQAHRPTRATAYWIMAEFTSFFVCLLLRFAWPTKKVHRKICFDVAGFDEKK